MLDELQQQNKQKKKRVCCICWLVILPLFIIVLVFTGLILLKMRDTGQGIADVFSSFGSSPSAEDDSSQAITTPEDDKAEGDSASEQATGGNDGKDDRSN